MSAKKKKDGKKKKKRKKKIRKTQEDKAGPKVHKAIRQNTKDSELNTTK